MGVVEIDHSQVKLRIQAILATDNKIFDPASKSGALVKKIWIGLPDGYNWSSRPFPYITITNSQNWENDKPFGAVSGTNPNSNISTSHHTVQYYVIAMDSKSSASATELSLDAIHKETKTALKNNIKLTDPTTGTNDLNCIQSIISPSKFVDGGQFKGNVVNGFLLTVTAIIVQ